MWIFIRKWTHSESLGFLASGCVDEARAGVIMLGIALIGARYFQEAESEVAMDKT